MSSKTKYRILCASERSIPIFARDWWLDVVCGDVNWDVAIVERGDIIVASLPFTKRTKNGVTILGQPQLTQALGPWIRDLGIETNGANRLGYEKKVYTALIEALPSYQIFKQSWHASKTNWLPFYWKGFGQTTLYTYQLFNLENFDQLYADMRSNVRGDIKKAVTRFGVRLKDNPTIDDFLKLNQKTYDRQGIANPESEQLIRNVFIAVKARNSGALFIAEDEAGEMHAGAFIVWDDSCAYYLMGGGDPELRKSGATSFCLWEAIKFASSVSRSFDFEGSMIEPIERYFRAFGAIQVPYFEIRSVNSKWVKTYLFAQSLLKK